MRGKRSMGMFLPVLLALPFLVLGCTTPRKSSGGGFCHHDETTFRCVKLTRVYDGNTIFVDIPDVSPFLGKNIGVRIRGIDTPKLISVLTCEKKKAVIAKDYLIDKLGSQSKKSREMELRNIERDKYFRILANVFYKDFNDEWQNIAFSMVSGGYAVLYDGVSREKVDWCAKK